MPFDVKRNFSAPSRLIWGIDWHPTEPWLITGDEVGFKIYNLESGAVIYNKEMSNVYSVKFISRKDWFLVGLTNGLLCVFNSNTHTEVVTLKAHSNWIRCLAIHPTASIVLTCSDDGKIKAWDWDKRWRNIKTYGGNSNWIISIALNPKDPDTFVSTDSEGIVKEWSITSPTANFTIQAHDNRVDCANFYAGADKLYLVTASDDRTVKVWDYLSKTCVQTIKGHTSAVNFAVFHPNLPIIVTGSQDGYVKIWNSETYGIEHSLDCRLGYVRCIALRKHTNEIVVGCQEGVLIFKPDYRRPIFSMSYSGELIYAHEHKILSADLQSLDATIITSDGAQIPLQMKDLNSTTISASYIRHSPNGRLVTVISDDKYTLYSALEWRNESSGIGISFAWAPDSNTYAVLETQSKLKIYNEKYGGFFTTKGDDKYLMDVLYTGPVLGARGFSCVYFWDWETREIVRKINNVGASDISWSTVGTHVAIASDSAIYIYYFDRDVYQDKLDKYGPPPGGEGIPESFTLLFTLHDTILSLKWIGECMIYTTSTQVCYSVVSSRTKFPLPGLESHTISPTSKKLYLLGYLPAHRKVYLIDEDMSMYGFRLNSAVAERQLAALKVDMDAAREVLKVPKVPKEQVNDAVKSGEGQGFNLKLAQSLDNLKVIDEVDLYQQCIALTTELFAKKAANKLICELRDDKAHDMADFISQMVDDENILTQRDRKRALYLLSKLAKSAGVFPQSLELEGIQCNLAKPVTWGGYGLIFRGEYEGRPVCIKAVQIDVEGINKKKLGAHASELIIWAHLLHLNILPFLGIYPSDEEVPRICIVSPWMNNGDLLQYLRKVPESPRKPLVRDIICGLQYLHDFDIIHADLKAKNVLVSETGRAMVADFGISRLALTQTTTATNVSGTAYWMAPELHLDDEPTMSRATDIWAFACTCYEVITGMTPFGQYRNPALLIGGFMRGKIVPLKPEEPGIGWDEDVWSVATQCWQSDPASRPGAHEILDMMNSFDLPNDPSSDPGSHRRNYPKIDYDHIFSILEEIRKSAAI